GLRAELIELGRQQALPAPRAQPGAFTAGYATTADGASFTVPLRVTISLDSAPPPAPTVAAAPAPATVAGRPQQLDPDVEAALADAEASRERPYYLKRTDAQKRERYYADVPPGAEDKALFSALSKLATDKHTNPKRYDPKKHVYPWVDLHPDLQLRSIYSGKTFPPQQLIREDARIEAAQKRLNEIVASGREASALEVAALEAQAQEPFNCEHVVPQSTFAKDEPMRGDLHHLFACESRCNSFRGNTPYFDFADFEEKIQQDCGKREGTEANAKFEPSNGKGAVARATLYFLLRYPGLIGDRAVELQASQLPLLLEWHRLEPVGEWELHRNAAIEEIQGNRNPLIDHPDWATKIDFAAGFGQST
ncbi:MAG: endonuclease, partial [Chloroflexota bacterium]|nr:endonuclease [Chloroflexota bacterium]